MAVLQSNETRLESLEAARKAVDVASDKQASDVVLLDLRTLSAFTDFFVICSADSARQISAIVRAIDEVLGPQGHNLRHKVGADSSGWVLMDYGDIVIHVFSPEARNFYDLEAAWPNAHQVVRIQ